MCLIPSETARALFCFVFCVPEKRHWTQSVAGKVKVLVGQWCPTLCDPVDCSPPGSFTRGVLQAAVHGVERSRTRLSDFTFTFHFHALDKEMATHSSVLAWRIPGTGEPGGLPSVGSHRVGHDWSDSAAAAGTLRSEECGAWGQQLLHARFVAPWHVASSFPGQGLSPSPLPAREGGFLIPGPQGIPAADSLSSWIWAARRFFFLMCVSLGCVGSPLWPLRFQLCHLGSIFFWRHLGFFLCCCSAWIF